MNIVIKKILSSSVNSYCGFCYGFRDLSFKLEVFFALIFFPVFFYFYNSTLLLKLVLFLSYILILIVELINTSIERLADRVCLDYDLSIKAVKDMSSAAVFLSFLPFVSLLLFDVLFLTCCLL